MALALKLSYFVIEKAAEPVSELLERSAARSPTFRSACMRLAKWHSGIDYRKEVRRLGYAQKLSEQSDNHADPGHHHQVPADDISTLEPPPELTEKEATTRGAEILGEAFVISIGLGLLLRQVSDDWEDEAEQQRTIEKNEVRIKDLENQVKALNARVGKSELAAAEQQRADEQLRQHEAPSGWSFSLWPRSRPATSE